MASVSLGGKFLSAPNIRLSLSLSDRSVTYTHPIIYPLDVRQIHCSGWWSGAQWECQHLNLIFAHFRLFHWSNFSGQVFFSRQYNLYFHEDVFCNLNSNSNKTFNTHKKWKKYLSKIFLFGLWETFTWLWETSAFINCLQLLQKVYVTHQEILQPLENKLVGASNPSLFFLYG